MAKRSVTAPSQRVCSRSHQQPSSPPFTSAYSLASSSDDDDGVDTPRVGAARHIVQPRSVFCTANMSFCLLCMSAECLLCDILETVCSYTTHSYRYNVVKPSLIDKGAGDCNHHRLIHIHHVPLRVARSDLLLPILVQVIAIVIRLLLLPRRFFRRRR